MQTQKLKKSIKPFTSSSRPEEVNSSKKKNLGLHSLSVNIYQLIYKIESHFKGIVFLLQTIHNF